MSRYSLKNFIDGLDFVKSHTQLIYTVFLLVIIPTAFVLSGQQFLTVSLDSLERMEKERIGVFHDVFAEFSTSHLDNPQFLQERMESIGSLNTDVERFFIAQRGVDEYEVIASLNQNEVGHIVVNPTDLAALKVSQAGQTHILAYKIDGIRHWLAVRSIENLEGLEAAAVVTDISMEQLDAGLASNIQKTYIYLAGIILAIVLLLLRQARVVDYTVLYKQLKDVDKMKDDFISIAAHELRTPLTIIRGYASMLGEKKDIDPADKKLVDRIEGSVEQLHLLIGDILDVSKLQQGLLSFDFQLVSVGEMLEEVVESLTPVASEKDLTLTYEKGSLLPEISVDEGRLKQVVINVVGNAVKYTLEGGISVSMYQEKQNLFIRVSDTGIGMTEEQRTHLFERFYRIQTSETREIRGTGLGLWISKKIVEQMKGSISVESIKGKGTDFILSFPIIEIKTPSK